MPPMESHAFTREPGDVWCLDDVAFRVLHIGMHLTRETSPCLVIGEQEKEIGLVCSVRSRGREKDEEEKKLSRQKFHKIQS